MLASVASLLILSQAKPFDPVGTWKPTLTLVEKAMEPGTPEGVKQSMRNSVKLQNQSPQILVILANKTYRTKVEEGTWQVKDKKLILTMTKEGKMKVTGRPPAVFKVAPDGNSFSGEINKMVQIRFKRQALISRRTKLL